MTSAPLSPWSAQGRCPPCPRTAIWSPAGGQAPQKHTTPTPPHPGHQLFSIIASQWIKLINIQTRWLLHPIFCCCCECVRSSSLDIGSVHMIPTCYNMALVLFHNFSFFYYKHVDILIVCCIHTLYISLSTIVFPRNNTKSRYWIII